MKKSEAYRAAQLAVMRDDLLDHVAKLEIIRVLQNDENIQSLVEISGNEKE